MNTPDTTHYTSSTVAPEESRDREEVEARDSLAAFSVLADPQTIAGGTSRTSPERETSDMISSLRSELSRRAREVQVLKDDLSQTLASKTDTDARLTELSGEVERVRSSIAQRDRERPGDPPTVDGTTTASLGNWEEPPFAPSTPASVLGPEATTLDPADSTLKRLLHDAHEDKARLTKDLDLRQTELEQTRREYTQLREVLSQVRNDLSNRASDANALRAMESEQNRLAADLARVGRERADLRGALEQAQKEGARAGQQWERIKSVLAETRSRVNLRETEAAALRTALTTTQKQASQLECDNAELKTALVIAGETLGARRSELSELRATFAALESEKSEGDERLLTLQASAANSDQEIDEQGRELDRLKTSTTIVETNLESRTAEVTKLQKVVRDHEDATTRLRDELAQTRLQRDTFDEQLASERSALSHAMSRATERESALASLRDTLASIGKAASTSPIATSEIPLASDEYPHRGTTPSTVELEAEDTASSPRQLFEPGASMPQSQSTIDLGGMIGTLPGDLAEVTSNETDSREGTPVRTEWQTNLTIAPPAERPQIFDQWRDGQIAKDEKNPRIESVTGYFAASLDRLFDAKPGDTLLILSLGGHSPDFELEIAKSLRGRGREDFRIHCPQRDSEASANLERLAARCGIDQELVPFAASQLDLIADISFHAIIGDGAISESDHPEKLIEVLRLAVDEEVLVVVAEETGAQEVSAAREMGDRIWQLMPERYKLNHSTNTTEDHYWRDSSVAPDSTDDLRLLDLLRGKFHLSEFTAFGHLIDRFVGREIGPNFDPNDERDLRFIEQIATLDEAKLESGALQPRHMVAELSKLSETR